VQVFTF